MITNNFRKILTSIFSSVGNDSNDPSFPTSTIIYTLVSIDGEEKEMTFYDRQGSSLSFKGIINAMNHMSQNSSNNNLYLKIGEGTIQPTKNDFQLNHVNTDVSCDSVVVGNSANYTKTYTATFSNPTNADITINEVGLYIRFMYYRYDSIGSTKYDDFLLDRTVLSTPITIPAGESKAITYKLGF